MRRKKKKLNTLYKKKVNTLYKKRKTLMTVMNKLTGNILSGK